MVSPSTLRLACSRATPTTSAATGDLFGARRLRISAAEHDRRGRELRALAEHWQDQRGEHR